MEVFSLNIIVNMINDQQMKLQLAEHQQIQTYSYHIFFVKNKIPKEHVEVSLNLQNSNQLSPKIYSIIYSCFLIADKYYLPSQCSLKVMFHNQVRLVHSIKVSDLTRPVILYLMCLWLIALACLISSKRICPLPCISSLQASLQTAQFLTFLKPWKSTIIYPQPSVQVLFLSKCYYVYFQCYFGIVQRFVRNFGLMFHQNDYINDEINIQNVNSIQEQSFLTFCPFSKCFLEVHLQS